MLIPERERRRVIARLMRGEKVTLDWGLVLAPPTHSSGRGAGGGYRWTFYDPPIRPDGRRGARRHRTAARLDERTWLRIEDDLRALEAAVVGLPRTELDVAFRDLAEHWLESTVIRTGPRPM